MTLEKTTDEIEKIEGVDSVETIKDNINPQIKISLSNEKRGHGYELIGPVQDILLSTWIGSRYSSYEKIDIKYDEIVVFI